MTKGRVLAETKDRPQKSVIARLPEGKPWQSRFANLKVCELRWRKPISFSNPVGLENVLAKANLIKEIAS